MQLTEGRETV
jgi:hypothetical protein